ncbi:uridine kinase [Bacillus sp. AFS018417]|uniref:uridine kinase n=1 Tax=Bacillus sp. AFS018417 TaxID=2033491 RepID=UPI000BF34B1F|nr:uridine kinase [Bacillus sp. AFS018417]PEZ07067.1 uridine kinase [Bacillus sp. AFS018417]
MKRQTAIREVAEYICMLEFNHPVRVGVSGITASGKTTFANELAKEIQNQGRKVIRTSIDYFHHPRAIRYSQGKESAKGYYEDAHDYKAFSERLLMPLGPNGTMRYEIKSHDLETDMYIPSDPILASKDTIFIVDGTFLFKQELKQLFDYRIFVETDFNIARERGSKREAQAFGSEEKAGEMFLQRYHAACHMYIEEHAPKECADVVLINNNIEEPVVVFNGL